MTLQLDCTLVAQIEVHSWLSSIIEEEHLAHLFKVSVSTVS